MTDAITRTVGLCAQCRNVDVITSTRQSAFYLCRLSTTDPRFPKYPRLPVLACDGYAPSASASRDRSIERTKE